MRLEIFLLFFTPENIFLHQHYLIKPVQIKTVKRKFSVPINNTQFQSFEKSCLWIDQGFVIKGFFGFLPKSLFFLQTVSQKY
jgi:hypothetical protein